jgi:isopentenyl-diphosphate Delta-isomerase
MSTDTVEPTQQAESTEQFETRKRDHIRLALSDDHQTHSLSALEEYQFAHEALPDLNFDDIDIKAECFGQTRETPFFISSMTAGHPDAININHTLAAAASARGWPMGVGSQRRELGDANAHQEWQALRRQFPNLSLWGNLGIAQLITSPLADIQKLCDALEAEAMIIHLNPLQECMQPEGTPNFKGAFQALRKLCLHLPIPVIVKETGCGFSTKTLIRLAQTGVAAVDVSGLGGTHWGRIEGARATGDDKRARAANTFKNWGVTTVDSIANAHTANVPFALFASGGVRTGLDAAKLLALGADLTGFAQPMLAAAMNGEQAVIHLMDALAYELKTTLFCTGCANLQALKENDVWL